MTEQELEAAVIAALRTVAPEADPESIDRDADVREELDVDSMDFLSFVTALHQKLGIDIPEKDYPEVRTVSGAVRYLIRSRSCD